MKKTYKILQDKCISCGTCDIECPKHAIIISSKGKFSVDKEKCVGCGMCANVCPMDAAVPEE